MFVEQMLSNLFFTCLRGWIEYIFNIQYSPPNLTVMANYQRHESLIQRCTFPLRSLRQIWHARFLFFKTRTSLFFFFKEKNLKWHNVLECTDQQGKFVKTLLAYPLQVNLCKVYGKKQTCGRKLLCDWKIKSLLSRCPWYTLIFL